MKGSSWFYQLSSSGNQHRFDADAIVGSIKVWLSSIQCDEEIIFKPNDVMVGALTPTGPYLVDLTKGYAEDLLDEAQIVLMDDSVEPVYTQSFHVKSSFATQSEVPKGGKVADKVLSIFYELDMHDYFGQVLDWGGLQLPLEKIREYTYRVFGLPRDECEIIFCQPKTEKGNIRNALRVIVKFNEADKRSVIPGDKDA